MKTEPFEFRPKAFAAGFAAMLSLLLLTGCNKPGTYWNTDKSQLQQVQLHAEWELEIGHGVWDIDPPDRLDIIMWPDHMKIYSLPAAVRCDNMGGELIYYPLTDQHICEGIDY